jgi:plastocyanin
MPCPSALTYKPAVGVGVAAAVSSVARVLSLEALEDFEARNLAKLGEKLRLLKQTMPILIGGLVGAVATMVLLTIITDRNLPADSGSEQAASHDAGGHAHGSPEVADGGPAVDLTGQSAIQLDIKDSYSRPNIKIAKGTRVTWTNRGTVEHNAMQEHSDGGEAHKAPTADDVRTDVFAGPLLAKGESYSFTFDEPGAYPYHCAPHPYMKGLVTVTP